MAKDHEKLQGIIDRVGLQATLEMVATICRAKSHAQRSDVVRARRWNEAAQRVDDAAGFVPATLIP